MSQLPTQVVRSYSDRVTRVVSREVGPQGPPGWNGTDGVDGNDGNDGLDGIGIPNGGATGQVLKKASATDYAVVWADETGGTGIPNGGTTGQVLTKQSNTNGDATWADPTGGTASLPNVLPAQVNASVLGGTVERTGLMSAAAPATGIAAEATVQSLLSSVSLLYTTLGEALTNGFIGIAINAEA